MDISSSVASKYVNELVQILGEGCCEFYIFGSRANGRARPDSDYDIAILLNDNKPTSSIRRLASDKAFPYLLLGTEIRPVVLRRSSLDADSQFARHIREIGIRLA